MEGESTPETRYFVMKCDHIRRIRTANKSCTWAVSGRQKGPQPRDVLQEAFSHGPVVLVFSVSGCHGWHGVATMVTPPDSNKPKESSATDSHTMSIRDANRACDNSDAKQPSRSHELCRSTNDTRTQGDSKTDSKATEMCHVLEEPQCESSSSDVGTRWHTFGIQWQTLYIREHGEQCLPFSATDDLRFTDGDGRQCQLNKARNLQELPPDLGSRLVDKLATHCAGLSETKRKKREESRVAAFFDPGDDTAVTATCDGGDVWWRRLLSQVEEKLGAVLLACPYGSRRYNLHLPESDTDMFVVFAAPTSKVLGFSPPPATVKSRDDEVYDYTILEVRRYCELLLSGDPQCVETLFLDRDCPTVYQETAEWRHLTEYRQYFLTKQCADKYNSDACGGKGLILLRKLTESGEENAELSGDKMSERLSKLFYIIMRLLRSSRDVAASSLIVYRADESPERGELLSIRRGEKRLEKLKTEVDSLQACVAEARSTMSRMTVDPETKANLERWLIDVRIKRFSLPGSS